MHPDWLIHITYVLDITRLYQTRLGMGKRQLVCCVIHEQVSSLPPTMEEVCDIARGYCLSVCVQDYSKTRAWIWMKCCVSTGIRTWTNWLTFEPDLDHSPDVGTGFLSHIAYALNATTWNFITSGKSYARTGIGGPSKQQCVVLRRQNTPCTWWYWGPIEAAMRGFEASKHSMHVLVLGGGAIEAAMRGFEASKHCCQK